MSDRTEGLTYEQAIALAETRFWEGMSFQERAVFQMTEERLCMPFDVFHEAVEKTLGRPVFTHEFGLNREGIFRELIGEQAPPTMEQILDMIPVEKRVVIQLGGDE